MALGARGRRRALVCASSRPTQQMWTAFQSHGPDHLESWLNALPPPPTPHQVESMLVCVCVETETRDGGSVVMHMCLRIQHTATVCQPLCQQSRPPAAGQAFFLIIIDGHQWSGLLRPDRARRRARAGRALQSRDRVGTGGGLCVGFAGEVCKEREEKGDVADVKHRDWRAHNPR